MESIEEFVRPQSTEDYIPEYLKYREGYGKGSGCGDLNDSGDGDGSIKINRHVIRTPSGYCYLNGEGYGWGDGSGYSAGKGSGYDYGNGRGDEEFFRDFNADNGEGDGSGYRYHDEKDDDFNYYYWGKLSGEESSFGQRCESRGIGQGIKRYNGMNVYSIDGIQTIITQVNRKIAKGFVLNRDMTLTDCYIVRSGFLYAHGETEHTALRTLARYKRKYEEPEIFIEHETKTEITYDLFRYEKNAYHPDKLGIPKGYKATIPDFIRDFRNKMNETETLVGLLCRRDLMTDQDLMSFAIWCSREELKYNGNQNETDTNAFRVAEKYVNGEVTISTLRKAWPVIASQISKDSNEKFVWLAKYNALRVEEAAMIAVLRERNISTDNVILQEINPDLDFIFNYYSNDSELNALKEAYSAKKPVRDAQVDHLLDYFENRIGVSPKIKDDIDWDYYHYENEKNDIYIDPIDTIDKRDLELLESYNAISQWDNFCNENDWMDSDQMCQEGYERGIDF